VPDGVNVHVKSVPATEQKEIIGAARIPMGDVYSNSLVNEELRMWVVLVKVWGSAGAGQITKSSKLIERLVKCI